MGYDIIIVIMVPKVFSFITYNVIITNYDVFPPTSSRISQLQAVIRSGFSLDAKIAHPSVV